MSESKVIKAELLNTDTLGLHVVMTSSCGFRTLSGESRLTEKGAKAKLTRTARIHGLIKVSPTLAESK